MSTPMSSSKSKKENIHLCEVFCSSIDDRYVVRPLNDLGMKTVHDVIICHNNKQNWQALKKKIKESAATEAASKIFDKKIATMIQHFEAGGDSFQKWVQERRNQEMHSELQMRAFHNQLYYLIDCATSGNANGATSGNASGAASGAASKNKRTFSNM